jgi:hypothetical protein
MTSVGAGGAASRPPVATRTRVGSRKSPWTPRAGSSWLSWCSRMASGWFLFCRVSARTFALTAANACLAGRRCRPGRPRRRRWRCGRPGSAAAPPAVRQDWIRRCSDRTSTQRAGSASVRRERRVLVSPLVRTDRQTAIDGGTGGVRSGRPSRSTSSQSSAPADLGDDVLGLCVPGEGHPSARSRAKPWHAPILVASHTTLRKR